MIKNWNRTSKIKAVILGALALQAILMPFGQQAKYGASILLELAMFGILLTPVIIFFNVAIFNGAIKKPKWNENPLTVKFPLRFIQFVGIFILTVGLSTLIGSGIRYQILDSFGLFSIAFGIGILIGVEITSNWKKLRIIYFITIGVFVINSLLDLFQRSYTKDEDIIKYFSGNFELLTSTTEKIIHQIDSIDFINDVKYEINFNDSYLTYTILRNYIYRDESLELSEETKNIIDSLFLLIDCSYIDFVDDKYVKLYTGLTNRELFNIRLLKVLDDSVLITKYNDWEILRKGELITNKKNWLYQLENNWYIESKIRSSKNRKENFPFETDLSRNFSYHENGKLKTIGRRYSYKENGNYIFQKHGKWLYLDSNEFIVKEEIYYFDSLMTVKTYQENEREKIEIDSTSTKVYTNGKWEKSKEYVID